MDQPGKADFKKRESIAARVSAAFKARGYQLVQYGGATDEEQKRAALILIAQALAGNLPLDWNEVDRVAALPGFKVQPVITAYKEEARRMLSLGT